MTIQETQKKLPSFASQVWTLTQSKQLTATAHLVLRALASFDGQRGLFPSHEAIAARAGCSTRTVIRALEVAYRLGIVERIKRVKRHGGRVVRASNSYILHRVDTRAAKEAARQFTRQLRAALERRKQRFFQTDKMAAESNLNSFYNYSKSDWLDILSKLETGMTPEQAGYRGFTPPPL